jgi:hypothetical protein
VGEVFDLLLFLRMLAGGVKGALERLLYRLLAFLLASIAVSLVLAIVISLLGRAAVHVAEGRVDTRWQETLGPLTALPDLLVSRPANRTAQDIEAVGAELGLQLSPACRDQPAMPSAASAARLAQVEATLNGFARSIVISESLQLSIPPELSRFVDEQQSQLQQIVKLAFADPAPQWELDISMGEQAPHPNLAAMQSLHGLLITDALQRLSRDDARSAAVVLEASRRLNQATLQRPEIDSFIASLAVLRLQLAAVRRFDPPPLAWIPYLEQLDLEPLYLQALQADAWRVLHSSHQVRLFAVGPSWARPLIFPLVRPFERWAVLDHSEAVRQAVELLPELIPAELERGELAAELHRDIPRWNWRAHEALPDVGGGWLQTVRCSLAVELTREVLGVRKTIGLAGDNYARVLPELAGTRPSLVEGYAWQYRPATDQLTIVLEGAPFELQESSEVAALPLQVSLHLESRLSILRRRAGEP